MKENENKTSYPQKKSVVAITVVLILVLLLSAGGVIVSRLMSPEPGPVAPGENYFVEQPLEIS